MVKELDPLVKKHRIEEDRISQLKEMFVKDTMSLELLSENIGRILTGNPPVGESGHRLILRGSPWELETVYS